MKELIGNKHTWNTKTGEKVLNCVHSMLPNMPSLTEQAQILPNKFHNQVQYQVHLTEGSFFLIFSVF